jgi:hypothetical protein
VEGRGGEGRGGERRGAIDVVQPTHRTNAAMNAEYAGAEGLRRQRLVCTRQILNARRKNWPAVEPSLRELQQLRIPRVLHLRRRTRWLRRGSCYTEVKKKEFARVFQNCQ